MSKGRAFKWHLKHTGLAVGWNRKYALLSHFQMQELQSGVSIRYFSFDDAKFDSDETINTAIKKCSIGIFNSKKRSQKEYFVVFFFFFIHKRSPSSIDTKEPSFMETQWKAGSLWNPNWERHLLRASTCFAKENNFQFREHSEKN